MACSIAAVASGYRFGHRGVVLADHERLLITERAHHPASRLDVRQDQISLAI
jgi:hypothetical protein